MLPSSTHTHLSTRPSNRHLLSSICSHRAKLVRKTGWRGGVPIFKGLTAEGQREGKCSRLFYNTGRIACLGSLLQNHRLVVESKELKPVQRKAWVSQAREKGVRAGAAGCGQGRESFRTTPSLPGPLPAAGLQGVKTAGHRDWRHSRKGVMADCMWEVILAHEQSAT